MVRQSASESGRQVLIDNRAGAGGNIGADLAARAAPDGYTLLMGTVATHAINPNLYPKMPYDAARDFAPIILVATLPNLLVVNPSVPARNVKELIALAKSKPGELAYASAGTPAKILLRLNQEAVKAIVSQQLRQQWLNQGIEPAGGTSEQLAAFQRIEGPKWAKNVRDSGARVE